VKALIPIAAILAVLIAADMLLNDGATVIAFNRIVLEAGQAFGRQVSKIVE
jgi:hypothetical protein